VGIFGYSDEDGTEAATYGEKLDEDEIRARTEHVTRLAEELTAQRAEERIGETLEVLLESVPGGGTAEGRAEHQGPEVDGSTTVVDLPDGAYVGQVVRAVVTASDGVDLVASAATNGKQDHA
jgi:tRNA A37 methylthiotransferase MiaB